MTVAPAPRPHRETSAAIAALAPYESRVASAHQLRRAVVRAGAVAVIAAATLVAVQRIAWMLVLPELVVGAALGLALVPLRKNVDVSVSLERGATTFFVLATWGVFLVGSCVARGVTPSAFLAGATLEALHGTLRDAGFGARFGAGLFAFKIVVTWVLARTVLRLSGDESAFERAAAEADGRWLL